MTRISKRSLKASKEGIQLASRAILRFPTKIDFAAELEISRSTVQNFFAGKPVGRENFHKICQELELCWQDVAELPQQQLITEPTVTLDQVVADSLPTEGDSVIAELRHRVRQRIHSMCGTMRVLDMSRPMPTEYIYVDVNVYEKIKGRRRLEFDSVSEAFVSSRRSKSFNPKETTPEWISGLSAANRYSKLIVFGKPGAGKTMFLKHLSLQCLQGAFESDRIPIFVPLRDFAESNFCANLTDYIALQLAKHNQPLKTDLVKKLLNEGKFFLVLDGLDEIKPCIHQQVCKYLRRFTEWFPNNRYLLSCRHGTECCNFEQFTEIEIGDFQPEQIADFATKWFDSEGEQKSISFLQKLKYSNSIQEFATSPLLLTLLCILFEESDFPASRSEIYEEGLDIMFKQWDAERNIERGTEDGLSPEQEKELLCMMALKAFEKNQYLFKEGELKFHVINYLTNLPNTNTSKINAKKVLKSIEAKHGLLVEQAKKVYSFSHLAFQEYLTARKFVCECDLEVSAAMLHHLVKNMLDERWREIFLLVAEMSPQADMLLEIMSQQINSQLAQTPEIKQFLDWVNCKTEVVIENSAAYSEQTQFQPATIRAFYLSLGLSQIVGDVGSNFDLALSLNPLFSRTFANNPDLTLDLNLLHVSNLGRNLVLIQRPALTFQRTLDRAIAHATKIKPELAQELQTTKQQLPSSKNSKTEFWLWWHQNGTAWSDKIDSIVMKHRNIGYQWQFDNEQHDSLKKYHQANLLLVDCLSRSCYLNPKIKEIIKDRLLTPTFIEQKKSQIESVLAHSLT
ncbi:NACHT domain-containing NTPase [Pleurocapsales cyanobacterium LEGE 10410]|nr:NACHT domain-containing NTPase [Pleurocapsales cyanobacterium LEGE 10410]